MARVRDIITKDITTVGKITWNIIEPAMIGFGRGAYTPFLASTSLHHTKQDIKYAREQFKENFDKPFGCFKEPVKMLINSCGQGFGVVTVHAPLAMIAYGENLGKEYLVALAVTNVIDYIWDVGRRSVEEE
ncbi:MAG: hypothetical protein ABIF40_02245 [archaeon]